MDVTSSEPQSFKKRKLAEGDGSNPHINNAPREIRQWIFHYLPQNMLFGLALVCKLWREDLTKVIDLFDTHPTDRVFASRVVPMLNHPFLNRNVKNITFSHKLNSTDLNSLAGTIGNRTSELSVLINMRTLPLNDELLTHTINPLLTMFHDSKKLRAEFHIQSVDDVLLLLKRPVVYPLDGRFKLSLVITARTPLVKLNLYSLFERFKILDKLSIDPIAFQSMHTKVWPLLTSLRFLELFRAHKKLPYSRDLPIFEALERVHIHWLDIDYNALGFNNTFQFLERSEKLKVLSVKTLTISHDPERRFFSLIKRLDKFSCGIAANQVISYLNLLLSASALPGTLITIIRAEPDDNILTTLLKYMPEISRKFPDTQAFVNADHFTLLKIRNI